MAVLNKIRQRSVFLIVIIALALFSFVLADVIRNGGFISQKSQNTIATINGNDIDRTEFATIVENTSAGYGGNSTIQKVNNAWNKIVRKIVFEEQFKSLGIKAGKELVNKRLEEALANNTTFQNDAGVFDKAKMQEYVANLKATSRAGYRRWLDGEKELAQQAQEELYFTMVKSGLAATLNEGKSAYKLENDLVDIKYVQLQFSSIPNTDVKVSDQDIESYLKKNSDKYEVESSRDIQYVLFEEKPSDEDEKFALTEMAKLIEDKRAFEKGNVDTIIGFKNTSVDKIEAFVNENSDQKFKDRFVFKKDLPVVAQDTLFNLPMGMTYGPYKDGEFVKISKMVAQTQIPDSVKAKHILVSWEGLSTARDTKRTKEEAKKLADSIENVIKSNLSQFGTLASKFSADTSNKDKSGDLGYFTPGRMVPAFNDFCFNKDQGEIGVVETSFGYHIIHIEEQKNKQKAVKVATIAQKVAPSEKTINSIFTEASKFHIEADKLSFEEVAKSKNLTIKPVTKIKSMDESIPALGAQRAIVQWAFNEDTSLKNVKRFDTSKGYVVVQLVKKSSKGIMGIDEARTKIEPILIKEKKAALLKDKFKTGGDLESIASSVSQTVKTASALNMKNPTISGAGREPEVVGAVFALPENQISKPVVGNNGVYVFQVTKKTAAPEINNYLSYVSQITTTDKNAVNYRVFNALKDAAEIEDKRYKFY